MTIEKKVFSAILLLAGVVGACFYGIPYDNYYIIKNKLVTPRGNRAKVLINNNLGDELLSSVFGLRGQIAHALTHNKIRADWVYNANTNDLVSALNDPHYQSIVVVGHGDTDGWRAKDKMVSYKTLEEKVTGEQKRGIWLQVTCGVKSGVKPLGAHFMKNPYRVYGYYGYTSPMDKKIRELQLVYKK